MTIMAQHTSKTDMKIFLNSSDFKGINTSSVVIAYMQRDNIPLIAAGRKSMLVYRGVPVTWQCNIQQKH